MSDFSITEWFLNSWLMNTWLGNILLAQAVFGVLIFLAYKLSYNLLFGENEREIRDIADTLYKRFWSGDELWQKAILFMANELRVNDVMNEPHWRSTVFALRDAERYEKAVRQEYDRLEDRRREEMCYKAWRDRFEPLYKKLQERAKALRLLMFYCERKVEVWRLVDVESGRCRATYFGEYDYSEDKLGDFLLDLDNAEEKRNRLVQELDYQVECVVDIYRYAQQIWVNNAEEDAEREEERELEREEFAKLMEKLPKWLRKQEERAVE